MRPVGHRHSAKTDSERLTLGSKTALGLREDERGLLRMRAWCFQIRLDAAVIAQLLLMPADVVSKVGRERLGLLAWRQWAAPSLPF